MKGTIKVAIYKNGVNYFYKTENDELWTPVQDVDFAEQWLILNGVDYDKIERIAEFKNSEI